MSQSPVFYTFRRCPYCMRAHMALDYAGIPLEIREVDLNNLPAEALAVSPHATVPSLVLDENNFMDESWDIMKWAVRQNDPDRWLGRNEEFLQDTEMLVETNDYSFKEDLEHYKYAERYPAHPMEYYRQRGEAFLQELEDMLDDNRYLLASHITVADIAVLPFIRQFVMVDQDWFDKVPYPKLKAWLNSLLQTEWFKHASEKREIWQPDRKDEADSV